MNSNHIAIDTAIRFGGQPSTGLVAIRFQLVDARRVTTWTGVLDTAATPVGKCV